MSRVPPPIVRVISVRNPDEIEIVRCLFREYASSLEIDLEYQGFSAELQTLPGAYRPPAGGLFLARVDDMAAGCVGIRPLRERICEMKRLYVRPAHRGAGLGPLLVQTAIEAARARVRGDVARHASDHGRRAAAVRQPRIPRDPALWFLSGTWSPLLWIAAGEALLKSTPTRPPVRCAPLSFGWRASRSK